MYFDSSISDTLPVYRNVNDEEFSLDIGLKGICISSVSWEWRSHEPQT